MKEGFYTAMRRHYEAIVERSDDKNPYIWIEDLENESGVVDDLFFVKLFKLYDDLKLLLVPGRLLPNHKTYVYKDRRYSKMMFYDKERADGVD